MDELLELQNKGHKSVHLPNILTKTSNRQLNRGKALLWVLETVSWLAFALWLVEASCLLFTHSKDFADNFQK